MGASAGMGGALIWRGMRRREERRQVSLKDAQATPAQAEHGRQQKAAAHARHLGLELQQRSRAHENQMAHLKGQ
eukprot:7535262-Pyramimonas_sp.AAC.1